MYCKNCGKELADGTRFCTACGAAQEQKTTQAEPTAPKEEAQPVQTKPEAENTQADKEPVQYKPLTGQAPPQNQPTAGQVPPQTPGQTPYQAPGQTPFQPAPEKKKINKNILILWGVAVVVVIAIIIGAVVIFSGTGIKGVVNKMEKGINNRDAEALVDIYPEFMFEDDDARDDSIDSMQDTLDEFDDIDAKVSITIKREKDVTDKDYFDDETYQEYYQELLEDSYDDFDGEIKEVAEVKLDMEYDFDEDEAEDYIAEALEDGESQTAYFGKIDGKWYPLGSIL